MFHLASARGAHCVLLWNLGLDCDGKFVTHVFRVTQIMLCM